MRFNQIHRRDFIALLGGAATWSLTAHAQQRERVRRIAWLGAGRADEPSPYLDSLRAGLRELGWTEGRNLTLSPFWATGLDNMEAAARELLASDPDVIVAQEFTVLAFRSVNTAKPVVFGFSGDPLDVKLVQSWARPGGNFTGMSYLAIELVGKRIGLLKEWLPQTRRIAVLARPQHPGAELERKASEEAAEKLGIELSFFPYTSRSFLPARDLGELEAALRAIAQDRYDALVVFPDSAMYEISDRIARFAVEAKLPSVSGWSSFANKGLLMTYGPNVRELYRSLAGYVDKIPARHPARRPAVPGTHNIVLGDQSQNRQGAWLRRPADATCSRRRGDRITAQVWNCAGVVWQGSIADDEPGRMRCAAEIVDGCWSHEVSILIG